MKDMVKQTVRAIILLPNIGLTFSPVLHARIIPVTNRNSIITTWRKHPRRYKIAAVNHPTSTIALN
jgi:hypothetical protein